MQQIRSHVQRLQLCVLSSLAFACLATCLPANDAEHEQFFETQVRPLLANRCFECHNQQKQQGEVRLDRKRFVFEEGAAGTAVVPGQLGESRLWQVIQYSDTDTQMPPAGKLAAEEIAILKRWIEAGAWWPEEAATDDSGDVPSIPLKADGSIDYEQAIARHWAYQPVPEPTIPAADPDQGIVTPIDRYLHAKLQEQGLSFSPPASRQQLIRRLSFTLRGLPPSYDEVVSFEQHDSGTAFSELVDRYLAESSYGERWGRYWLDVARYADTKGYVFTENRFYPYSYTYRDYVIDAFNHDKPYDEFLMEQLAADHLGYAENDPRLAALGFLTIGNRFLNRMPDIIDDRIDVVTRGLMGMTLACSRCHDHKFDPLPTADYYSLYGMFDSSYEPPLPPLRGEVDTQAPGYADFATELAKREQALEDYKINTHRELLTQAQDRLEDYFPAAMKALGKLPAELDLQPKQGQLREKISEHWRARLDQFFKTNHPTFRPAAKLLSQDDATLAAERDRLLEELAADAEVPRLILDRLRTAEQLSRITIVEIYVALLAEIRNEWRSASKEDPERSALADVEREQLRKILFGPGSLEDLAAGDYSPLFERDNRDKISGLRRNIDEWHATSPNAPARSMVLLDKDKPVDPVVFVRGNVGRRGDRVPRRGPQILNPDPAAVFKDSSGRKELAEQIVSKQNPLTARVLVNRIWMNHFGTPLEESTADFGLRTAPPEHRELLDYLAWSLMHEHNWSLKGLHREILNTRAWQQQSLDRPEARKVDPENHLYWKQNRQRLDFESLRDSMLSAANLLDRTVGGRPVDIEKHPFPTRRSVYALIDRNNPSGLLRTFDFPSPNSSSPGRAETTVPQQALFGMNAPFSLEMSQAFADRVKAQTEAPEEQVAAIVQIGFSRAPSAEEREILLSYLIRKNLVELAQAILLSNEFYFID